LGLTPGPLPKGKGELKESWVSSYETTKGRGRVCLLYRFSTAIA